jgi:hypothetical protein
MRYIYATAISRHPEWDRIGDHWPRKLVDPLRHVNGRAARDMAERLAEFGQPMPSNVLVLKHKGRRGWVVSRIIPGYVWERGL